MGDNLEGVGSMCRTFAPFGALLGDFVVILHSNILETGNFLASTYTKDIDSKLFYIACSTIFTYY